jgi:hypothetical protein
VGARCVVAAVDGRRSMRIVIVSAGLRGYPWAAGIRGFAIGDGRGCFVWDPVFARDSRYAGQYKTRNVYYDLHLWLHA